MALSGNYHKYATSSFGLYVEWSATQSVTGNYSDVTQNIYLSYYTLEVGSRSDSTSSINGTSVTYTAPAITDYSSGWKKKLLKTHTVRVNHNSSGKAENIALSASWRFSGTYSGVSVGTITASTTITLDSIDRTAPTVSCSVTNITSSGFKINATSSVTADAWEYSTNDGSSYTQFSTTSGTSASITLSGLTANTTYKVKVRARKKSNQVKGVSSTQSAKTLGATVINSASTISADDSTVTVTMNLTVYDGSFYHKLTIKNGSTTILTTSAKQFSAGTGSRSVTLTASERTTLLAAMASIKSFTATLSLATYTTSACSTQVGSATTKTCSCTTSESTSKPTFAAFTYQDTRTSISDVVGSNQILVKDFSYLRVVCTAGTAKNGASIKNYSANIGSASKTSTTTTLDVGTINSSGTLTLTVTCTDTRGYSTSVTAEVIVLNYSKPKLTSYKLRRMNEVDALVQLSFSGSFSAIKADGTTNTNSLKYAGYYYKKTSDTSWSSYRSLLSSVSTNGTTFSFSTNELIELDTESSYDFHILIRDQLDTYTSCDLMLVLLQGTPLVALRKRTSSIPYPRVGINNANPQQALDVSGNIAMNGILVQGFVKTLDGENFNTLKTAGIYKYTANPTSSNAPSSAGLLEVISSGEYLIQRFTAFVEGCPLYVRSFGNSTWTSWTQK